jgi:hypothetical protein
VKAEQRTPSSSIGRARFMKNLRKARLFSLVVLVWASHQFALHGVEFEPEVGGALEACSSLDQFTKWISELSGETESSVRGKAFWILTRYVYSEDVLTAEDTSGSSSIGWDW